MLLDTNERHSAVADPVDDRIEALIREARRRARRRRIRRLAAVAVLVGLGAAAYAVLGASSNRVIGETATRPFVDVHAFERRGELAFVSRGQVWVLDGGRGTLRRLPVPEGYTPSSPVFSHDGRWLAYVVSRTQRLLRPVRALDRQRRRDRSARNKRACG